MKFKKIKKRKVYSTWKYKHQKTGIEMYIYEMPEDNLNYSYFHFRISSVKSKIYQIQYSSLDELKIYDSFENTVEAIIKWWNEIIEL